MSEPDDEDHYGEVRYRNPALIEFYELPQALESLQFMTGDMFLKMQITNLSMVDQFIMTQETELLSEYLERDRTPMDLAMFVSAQSQMWIFAAYELMRTWRQRAKETIKLAQNGGLLLKAEALEKDEGYIHLGKAIRAKELREVAADPSLVGKIELDLRRSHIPFGRMEYIRVALAKHEVSGNAKAIAYAPGYGRINMMTGALDYQMSSGKVILGNISRRDIADELRSLANAAVPDADEIKQFDDLMSSR